MDFVTFLHFRTSQKAKLYPGWVMAAVRQRRKTTEQSKILGWGGGGSITSQMYTNFSDCGVFDFSGWLASQQLKKRCEKHSG